jgi:hypothetical protein
MRKPGEEVTYRRNHHFETLREQDEKI